ncbi:hypothetical protein GTW25_08740 [Aliihoeflea aestuarii]|uniref:hypothetical protein n=1 Tax=Aliihoeflea aestuarii TaxID=453840 RepID=UPI002092ECD6|nr:hypothetical protein [Aliihoeflea aestuarii]MCO6391113.1 hypothetical protein [Aliihoeflea aestuarii]
MEGIYVVSNTAGFYWERVYAPAVAPTILAFGAAVDGVTDDSSCIQAALDVCGKAIIPWTATGFVAGNITLGTRQEIFGTRKVQWKTPSGAYWAVRVRSHSIGGYAKIESVLFDLSACPTSVTAIRFGLLDGNVFGFRAHNVDFMHCGEAIGDEDTSSNYIVDVIFEDCLCYFTRGRQVRSRRSRGFITFRDFKIDHTYNSAQVTWGGALFTDVIGLELEKFDVVGPVQPASVYQNDALGLGIYGTTNGRASIWLTRVLIDNTREPGLVIDNVFNVFSDFLCIFQNLGQPLSISNSSDLKFANTQIRGARGLTGAPDNNGIPIVNSARAQFTNTVSDYNLGHGVSL